MTTVVRDLAPFTRKMPHAAESLSAMVEVIRELPEGETRRKLAATLLALMAGLAQDVTSDEPVPR